MAFLPLFPKICLIVCRKRWQRTKKAPARHKAEDDYLLTTKLFCGYCGAYLCRESGTSRTGLVHHYYKCVSVKKKRAECHKKPVKKQWIEDLVVDETMKMVMDDKAIEAIVSMLMELQNRESSSLPLYEKELKDTEAAIDNMLNAIQQGIFNKSTKARLDELEAAKDELENMIACEKLAKPKITEEQMMFWLHRFRKLDVSKKEHRQMLIDTFVNAIYLYDDKMLITFNYKDGTKTITFDEATTALANKDTGSNLDCLCVWLSRTGLEAGGTKRSCGAFCPAGERKQSGRAARSASKGRFERRVPPPAPNTEAPVGCLCVWLNRTGLEAGKTKRSCGAFCPAGERKQSGRAARSASKGRFERRVPPPGAARLLSCKLYRSLMWVPIKVRDFDGRGGAAQ